MIFNRVIISFGKNAATCPSNEISGKCSTPSKETIDKIKGKIAVNRDNQVLLFTVPYDRHLEILVDGECVETTKVLDALIAVPLLNGEHSVEIYYKPVHLYVALIISLICSMIASGIIIFEKHNKQVK